MSENETKTNTDFELITLLNEIHDKMYEMTEWCERLQPIHINESNKEIVDLTHEMYDKTKLFRLTNDIVKEDQTSRSILKDIRKYIRHLEQ